MVGNEGRREEIGLVGKGISVVVNSYSLGYIKVVGRGACSRGCKDNKTS